MATQDRSLTTRHDICRPAFSKPISISLICFYIFSLMQTFILFLIIYFIFKLVHGDGHSGFRQGEHVPSFS